MQSNKGTDPDSSYLFEQGEADDKIIAVCADDPEYKHFNDIKELPPHRLAEIRRFFEDCILVDPLIFIYAWQTFHEKKVAYIGFT
jgi:inorganic pyrophosphatase